VVASIQARELCRSFGKTVALDRLSFDVEPGEIVALLGPNGAGKTTTVRLLNGVLRPDGGSCRVLGLDPAVDGREVRARSGVLTENSGLDDRLTATENVASYASIRGMAPAEARRKAVDMLERFGMGDRVHQAVQGMSTGQRKRVGLARSLLHDPEVLFLDEPTSGLDPAATREVIELIGALAHERGRSVVLCTHFLPEASRLCRRVAILEQGQLVAFGRPEDLAHQLWPGLAVDLETSHTPDERTISALGALRGVLSIETTAAGAHLRVADREALPNVVATLVAREIAVYGVIPRPPTLEAIYFALTGRGDAATIDTHPSARPDNARPDNAQPGPGPGRTPAAAPAPGARTVGPRQAPTTEETVVR
jgi:ABC-2 type transport system ATP-binding protein